MINLSVAVRFVPFFSALTRRAANLPPYPLLRHIYPFTRLPTHTRYVAKRAAGPELRRNTKTRELKHALKLKELVCVLMLARIRKIRPAAAGRHAGIGPRGGRRVSLTGYLAPP